MYSDLKIHKDYERNKELDKVNVDIKSGRKIVFIINLELKTEYIDYTKGVTEKIKKEAKQSNLKWTVVNRKVSNKLFSKGVASKNLIEDKNFRRSIVEAGYNEILIISNISETLLITNKLGLKDADTWTSNSFGFESVPEMSRSASNSFNMEYMLYNMSSGAEEYLTYSGEFLTKNVHVDLEIFI